MVVSIEYLSIKNHYLNPKPVYRYKALNASPSLRFSIVVPRVKVSTKGLGVGFQLPQRRESSFNRSTVVFAASHEESKSSEDSDEIKEEWEQALAAFREEAIKMQGISLEAHEVYSKRAIAILKETSEQLKIEAEKARKDLTVVATELGEDGGKRHFTEIAKNSPEGKKFPADDVKKFSTLFDSKLKISYHVLLSLVAYMVVDSHIIFLCMCFWSLNRESLRSHKKWKPSHEALLERAVIATVIFVREVSILSPKLIGPNPFSTILRCTIEIFAFFFLLAARDQWYMLR